MNRASMILHGVVVAVLVAAYTVLVALGHDGDPLLGVLVGYLGGAGAQAAAAGQGQRGGP